jgi:small subunit ribosomal protein S19e
MTKVFDIPANIFIEELSKVLKASFDEITPLPWSEFVKTASYKEKPPANPEWWYIRASSILRKLYIRPDMGVQRLRIAYGGKKKTTHKPERFVKSSGNIIRKIFQQLESVELVEKSTIKGRKLTDKGISFLDKTASDLKPRVVKEIPPLQKYS